MNLAKRAYLRPRCCSNTPAPFFPSLKRMDAFHPSLVQLLSYICTYIHRHNVCTRISVLALCRIYEWRGTLDFDKNLIMHGQRVSIEPGLINRDTVRLFHAACDRISTLARLYDAFFTPFGRLPMLVPSSLSFLPRGKCVIILWPLLVYREARRVSFVSW